MAFTGLSLGNVMKHTYDGVVMGNGGNLPEFETLYDDMPVPSWTPKDIMLKGTASRILFGDPSLIVIEKFTEQPFETSIKELDENRLEVKSKLINDKLKSTFTDTYQADMNKNNEAFNDRILLTFQLPEDWDRISKIEDIKITATGKDIEDKLVAFAVEKDNNTYILHIQIDVPTSGYMESDIRNKSTEIEFTAIL